MTSVTGGATATFCYDGDGQRVEQGVPQLRLEVALKER